MQVKEKQNAVRKFNNIVSRITELFEDRISSQEYGEYITLKYQVGLTTERYVMVAFDPKMEELELHAWERTWRTSSGMYHSQTIFRSEIDLTADFLAGDIYTFGVKPVLNDLLND